MTFVPSDIDAVSKALSRWELGEYIASALVTIGCIGEYAADFTDWITGGVKERKEYLAKCSTLLLIAALSLEILCVVRTNQLSGNVIDFLGEKAKEAGDKAKDADRESKTAISDSSTALSQAQDAKAKAQTAQDLLGKAENESNKAQVAASRALILASGARKEADSFEKDIVSAKKEASDAESHLAEALRQAAAATKELDRLKTPRSLANASALVSTLREFKGTAYTFSGVFQDQESIALLKQIDSALQLAGWTRAKLPPSNGLGDIVINVFKGFGVPPTVLSGVFVEVKSSEKLESLQTRPQLLLPQYIRAALALKSGFASIISPTQDDLRNPLAVDSGDDSATVFITVGKKP